MKTNSNITDEHRVAFLLATASNLVAGVTTNPENGGIVVEDIVAMEALLETNIEAFLALEQYGELGLNSWKIAWGPKIYIAPLSDIADNAMVVFQKGEESKFVVSIAGTNSGPHGFGSFGWAMEDMFIGEQVPLPWGFIGQKRGLEPKISAGTMLGFFLLKNMREFDYSGGIPDPLDDLETFLHKEVKKGNPVEITVVGHSLGGSLATIVALWLSDKYGSDENVAIKCIPFAGFSAGNALFADRFDSHPKLDTMRVYNSLDPAPYTWNAFTSLTIPGLYKGTDYAITDSSLKTIIVGTLIILRDKLEYSQIATDTASHVELEGEVDTNVQIPEIDSEELRALDLTQEQLEQIAAFGAQALHQHVFAYFELLGLALPPVSVRSSLEQMGTPVAALLQYAAEQRIARRKNK